MDGKDRKGHKLEMKIKEKKEMRKEEKENKKKG
jgi:hypothetical protein